MEHTEYTFFIDIYFERKIKPTPSPDSGSHPSEEGIFYLIALTYQEHTECTFFIDMYF